jgi:hypothetical protein
LGHVSVQTSTNQQINLERKHTRIVHTDTHACIHIHPHTCTFVHHLGLMPVPTSKRSSPAPKRRRKCFMIGSALPSPRQLSTKRSPTCGQSGSRCIDMCVKQIRYNMLSKQLVDIVVSSVFRVAAPPRGKAVLLMARYVEGRGRANVQESERGRRG